MAQNNSILNLHYREQAVKAHCDLNSGNELKSLWIEIPGHCHLCCGYCMASTKKNQFKSEESHLTKEEYKKLLEDFAKEGGKFIGIPGRGEPFHQENINLVKDIIIWAKELELKTTIFTTGDTLFFPPSNIEDGKNGLNSEQEPDYDLINFLMDKDVVLLIKYNTKDSIKQDAIVSTKNYTVLREKAIELLLKTKEENKEKWKLDLGIVTSILPDNSDEIENLYEEFHNQKGFIFDCDTILPRGKGKKYHDSNYDSKDGLTYKKINEVFLKLKEKGATLTCQGGTYVGVACDRIKHHLYVSLTGDVYPCIGCFENPNFMEMDGSSPFLLGNIKNKSLLECWNHPLRKKLRCNTRDIFEGVCLKCQNFKDETCYSCLGRYTKNIKKVGNDNIVIETRGCTFHRPILIPWINKSVDYLRKILAFQDTKKLLENKNKGLEALWKVEQKHYRYADLFFPLNKVLDLSIEKEENSELESKFLFNVFLSSLKILLESHYAKDKTSVICNIMFYDNIKNQYFYRTISKGEKSESATEIDKSLILFRWAENFKDGNYFSVKSKGRFFNVSEVFRNSLYREYELILTENEHTETNGNIFNLSCFFKEDSEDTLFIRGKIEGLNSHLEKKLNDSEWDNIKELLNKKIFSELTTDEEQKLSNFFEELNKQLYPVKDSTVVNSILDSTVNCIKSFINQNSNDNNEINKSEISKLSNISDIQTFVDNKESEKLLGVSINFLKLFIGDNFIPTINYLIFLGYLHKYLNINYYLLEHSKSFKTAEENSDLGYEDIIDPSGILICSENRINRDFKSELILLISNVFQPIDEFYFDKKIRQSDEFVDKINAHKHTINNIAPHIRYNLRHIDKEVKKIIENKDKYFISQSYDHDIKFLSRLIEDEEITFNILNMIINDSLRSSDSQLGSFLDTMDLCQIIEYIVDYCNRMRDENCDNIIDFKPSFEIKNIINDYIPKAKKVDIFTIFYNLLINANKASSYKQSVYIFINKIDDDKIKVEVKNTGLLLDDKIKSYVNNKNEKPRRRNSGLHIVKKKATELNWIVTAENAPTEKTVNLTDKYSMQYGTTTFSIIIPKLT